MIRNMIAATGLVLLFSPWAAQAAEKTATLNVHNAYCELCPSIVTKTLQKVSGVKAVKLTKPDAAGDMTASITFDDAMTAVAKLIAATTKAGYPSEAAGPGG